MTHTKLCLSLCVCVRWWNDFMKLKKNCQRKTSKMLTINSCYEEEKKFKWSNIAWVILSLSPRCVYLSQRSCCYIKTKIQAHKTKMIVPKMSIVIESGTNICTWRTYSKDYWVKNVASFVWKTTHYSVLYSFCTN